MKRFTAIIAIIACCMANTVLAQEITRKMESAAEKYVKAWVRADDSLTEDKRSSEAREEAMKVLKSRKVLEVDEATEKKLKKREEIVTDAQLTTAVDAIKDSKDKESELLKAMVKKGRLKGEPRLLVYRLLVFKKDDLKRAQNEEIAKFKAAREDALRKVYQHFQARTTELSKPPSTIGEVALPADIAKFEGKTDWLFLYGPRKFGTTEGNLVFAEPTADAAGNIYAVTDKGRVIPLNHASLMEQVAKMGPQPAPQPAPNPTPEPQPEKADPTPAPDPAPAPQQAQQMNEYDTKIVKNLRDMLNKLAVKQKETGRLPNTLADIGLAGDAALVTSPDGVRKAQWHYLSSNIQAEVAPKQFVIILAPFPSADRRYLAILNDNTLARLSPAEAKKIIDVVEQVTKQQKKAEKKPEKKPETDFVPQ